MCHIKYNFQLVLIVLVTLLFSSCSKDSDDPIAETITVSTSDFSITMDENPANGQVIGTVQGSTNQGSVTFSITEQTPAGAFSIDATSGELKVLDGTLFNFDIHPKITGTVKVANGSVFKNASATITLKDGYVEKIYEGDVILRSQQDVDDFGFQQYTHITGSLTIGELQSRLSDIEDLKPLRDLTIVGRDLEIVFNGKLRSTLGFENLSSLGGGLAFGRNLVLEKIEGMQNITSIPENLEFFDNPELSNLDGINQIKNVGKGVYMYDMPKVRNLDWMINVSSIGGLLTIGYCGIENVDGLSNLRNLGTNLSLAELPNLINLDGLSNLSTNIEGLTISDNNSLLSIKGIRNIKPSKTVLISKNRVLESLDGLQGVESSTFLIIGSNDTILNLKGLNNLKSVNGKFMIASNRGLKDLSGLDSLNNVDSDLEVAGNYLLKDFCGLRDFLTNGTLSSFIAVNNAFNPTKQDIIDGNCKI